MLHFSLPCIKIFLSTVNEGNGQLVSLGPAQITNEQITSSVAFFALMAADGCSIREQLTTLDSFTLKLQLPTQASCCASIHPATSNTVDVKPVCI
jgi:hypothetical protein